MKSTFYVLLIKIREWLSMPFSDIERIVHRQSGVAMAVRAQNFDFVTTASKLLRKTHDLPRLILRLKKVCSTHSDWYRIWQTLDNAAPLLELIDQFTHPSNSDRMEDDKVYLRSLMEGIDTSIIRGCALLLFESIDFELSKTEGNLTIRDGYDINLDNLRATYAHLDENLMAACRGILNECPLLKDVSVEYVPQIGYLVVIKESDQYFVMTEDNNNSPFVKIYTNDSKIYLKVCIYYDTV
jgi:DNA mismatch repair ATPase MutS